LIKQEPLRAERYLSKDDLATLLGCSKQTIVRMSQTGELPDPLRFSHKMVRWRESDITIFLLGKKTTKTCSKYHKRFLRRTRNNAVSKNR
jgi:predicted DNA-binding transcriptional regulator AlpA